MSSWRSQEWEAYSGPLCDDPAERVGERYDQADDRGVLWEDLDPREREYLTRLAER